MSNQPMHEIFPKPARDEWLRWAEIIVERLTTCVHVYSKPPYEDVFIPDAERQEKNARALALLKRVHALTDEGDTPSDSLSDVEHHDERVIAGLLVLFKETLNYLPELSTDMQKLLKSHWSANCNGRRAEKFFCGPEGKENEGIGSGHAEHGRLPQALADLLEREQTGDTRTLQEITSPRRHDHGDRHHHAEMQRRYFGTAGRVE